MKGRRAKPRLGFFFLSMSKTSVFNMDEVYKLGDQRFIVNDHPYSQEPPSTDFKDGLVPKLRLGDRNHLLITD